VTHRLSLQRLEVSVLVEIFDSLLKLVLVVIVMSVLSLVAVNFLNPTAFVQDTLPDVIGDPVTIVYSNIPCMINCLTSLEGEELSLLSQSAFLDIDDSPILLDWFPCNNKIMTIAIMVNEMVKFKPGLGDQLLRNTIGSGDLSFYNQTKNLLYTCITNPLSDPKCYHYSMSFRQFCRDDTYLSNYNFLPCTSPNTFVDFLSKSMFSFTNRRGDDIDNNFVCDQSIGDAYNPGYSLCTPDPAAKYDADSCWPSWMVLAGQEQLIDSPRNYSYGRCEDFALLYYSLFRAIDVPPSDMELVLGGCELPCQCQYLLWLDNASPQSNISSQSLSCYSPAQLNVMLTESIDSAPVMRSISGCDERTLNTPDSYGGTYVITRDMGDSVYNLIIDAASANRILVLDDDFTNDVRNITIGGENYTSENILASLGLGVVGAPITGALEDVSTNGTARFGFKIKINELTNCDGNSTVVALGFTGSPATYYTLLDNEERGLLHNGLVTGSPYYQFFNDNPECVVDYEISNAGVILDDACNYYTGSASCNIIDGYCYPKSDPNTRYPLSLEQFISGSGC